MRQAADISEAVLSLTMAKYEASLVSACSPIWNSKISPLLSRSVAPETAAMTWRSPRLTSRQRARARRKSPMSTATWSFHLLFTVALPRRVPAPSTTSSWITVAAWIISTPTPASMTRSSQRPVARVHSTVRAGRRRLPLRAAM